MALINCPECNKEISDTAKNCIHCGYVLKEENTVVQPQTVVIAPVKGKSAKKSLNIGVTIILVVTAFSLLAYLVVSLFIYTPLSQSISYIDLDEIGFISNMWVIPALISIIMSILIYSKPKLRKIWFKIVYILISLSVWALSYTFMENFWNTALVFMAYIVGIVFIVKSMFIKD